MLGEKRRGFNVKGIGIMSKEFTSSAGLHKKLGAFGMLFATLVVAFNPYVAFGLAIVAAIVLAQL